jgi:hypothetical protein
MIQRSAYRVDFEPHLGYVFVKEQQAADVSVLCGSLHSLRELSFCRGKVVLAEKAEGPGQAIRHCLVDTYQ